MDIQADIYRIANKLNVKLSDRNPRDSYLWNGEDIGIGGLDFSNQLHELGHWQVATPELRLEKDFGLGPGPETYLPVERKVANTQEYEEEASLLGIAYEAHLGLNYEHTLRYHNWEFNEVFWETVSRLQQKGLLMGHLPMVR